jgi:hypothetical protein
LRTNAPNLPFELVQSLPRPQVESTLSCGIEGDEYASIRCQEVEYAVPDWQTLRTSAELPLHWGSLWEIEDDEFMSIFLEKVEYALSDW